MESDKTNPAGAKAENKEGWRTQVKDDWDVEIDCETFERMRKSERVRFPTSNERKARRSSKETFGSKKVRKTVSSKGGMHRRRQKKII